MRNIKLSVAMYLTLMVFTNELVFAACNGSPPETQPALRQTLEVSVQLSRDGKVVEKFTGYVLDGEKLGYSRLINKRDYETGFEMDLKPQLTGTGSVFYEIKVRQRTLVPVKQMPMNKTGMMSIELPNIEDDETVQSTIVKLGEPFVINFGFDRAEKARKYDLILTACTPTI